MDCKRIFWLAVCALFLSAASTQLFAQEEIFKKRKDLMNANYDALKAIKKAVEEKDYPTTGVKAREIMGYMDHVPGVFPKGAQAEKSKAKPEIWEKWDEFTKLPLKVKEVAGALATAAAAKDESGVRAQLKNIFADSPFRSGVCFDCHKDYRSSPPAKTKS
jgi:cytochrome c556